nr:protein kinase-like domain, phloem protein 2-like protein [Tanacetum cinerariifolium]
MQKSNSSINVVLHNFIMFQGKNLEHLKISLSLINQATNNFDEAYCIGSGGFDHGKQKMIYRDIKSDNILLGDNWKAKIADFGLSKFHPVDQSASTFYTSMIAGTYVYLDPEYQKDGKLSKKSDIYSFGVENHKDNLKLSLEDIKLATKGFSQDNIIGHGDSGNLYKGEK